MLAPSLTTPPTGYPVSLVEAKAHLRVEFSDDDALINVLIAAATSHLDGADGILGRALLSQVWRQDFEAWGDDGVLRLPLAPVSAIGSVKYSDAQNVEQTVADGQYALLHDERGAFIRFNSAFTAPGLYDDRADRVRVAFTAGYATVDDVPGAIKNALLLMIGDLYAARESFSSGAATAAIAMSLPVDFLLQPFRRVWGR